MIAVRRGSQREREEERRVYAAKPKNGSQYFRKRANIESKVHRKLSRKRTHSRQQREAIEG